MQTGKIPSSQEVVQDLPHLSSLPAVVQELESKLNDPRSGMQDYGKIIEKDTALAARLLRIANSAFYGFNSSIENVGQALTLIGLDQIKTLLSAANIIDYFEDVPPETINMRSFWEHSIACGIAAKVLAVRRRVGEPESFFVAGLAHDIGKLVLLNRIPDIYAEVFETYKESDKPLVEVENEILGYSHAIVGGALAREWSFPVPLVESIESHHCPFNAQIYPTHAAVVNIADILVHTMRLGESGENGVPRFDPRVWERLNLPESCLGECLRETERQYSEVINLFL